MKLFRKNKKRTWLDKTFNSLLIIIFFCLIIPQSFVLPVEKMKKSDYNQKSYWHYPWGKSGTHKGVDIFGKKGTSVVSPVRGFTFATGNGKHSGKYVIVLGPKLRFHYFAYSNVVLPTNPHQQILHYFFHATHASVIFFLVDNVCLLLYPR